MGEPRQHLLLRPPRARPSQAIVRGVQHRVRRVDEFRPHPDPAVVVAALFMYEGKCADSIARVLCVLIVVWSVVAAKVARLA